MAVQHPKEFEGGGLGVAHGEPAAFSPAMIGAETMFTSDTWARSRPARTALDSALVFMVAT